MLLAPPCRPAAAAAAKPAWRATEVAPPFGMPIFGMPFGMPIFGMVECASVEGAVLGAWGAWGSLPGVPMTAPLGEPAAALPLGLKIDATLSAGTNP